MVHQGTFQIFDAEKMKNESNIRKTKNSRLWIHQDIYVEVASGYYDDAKSMSI